MNKEEIINSLRTTFTSLEKRLEANNMQDSDSYHEINNARIAIDILEGTNDPTVILPKRLTAENGAKALLIGEFVECFDPDESGNPYIVPITWDSIKKIYKKIVSHYGA
jgi:hypothetical protein